MTPDANIARANYLAMLLTPEETGRIFAAVAYGTLAEQTAAIASLRNQLDELAAIDAENLRRAAGVATAAPLAIMAVPA